MIFFSQVASVTIGTNGYYEFRNVPAGLYRVIIDLPGLEMNEIYTFEIGDGEVIENVNYTITENGIFITPPVGIKTLTETKLRVYPNPTTGEFKVSGLKFKDGTQNQPQSEVEVAVEIFDMTGRNVGAYSIHPDGLVDISHLPNGLYLLRIGNQTIKITKK